MTSGLSRRELLAGAVLATARPLAAQPQKVIVAGGGIAGLSCGYELMKRGHDVTVLEAAGIPGGHVRTVRDGLADGLYVDAGAEHFTKPGYDLYWGYVREFDLPVIEDRRRENVLRLIGGRMYSEEELRDTKVLAGFGLNQREVEFLQRHHWSEFSSLYFDKYADAFQDEYKPFGVGLDELDQTTSAELLKRDGASAAAVSMMGGNGSALHTVWHSAILKRRGVPSWPTGIYRLKGGNSLLTDTFAKKLGARLRLGCPVTAVRHGDSGVTVTYREAGAEKQMEAGHLVCAMSAVMLRQIPVTPAWPEAKRWAIESMPYYSATRPVFQSRTKFWKEQKVSLNISFGQAALEHIWSMADEVPTERGLVVGTASPGVTAERALREFRTHYPGRSDTIESALMIDWSRDPWASACETTGYRPGELKKFWPAIIEKHGRIHFAGAYCDNLNWGQEAATRSANRVAKEIG
jgi:monoamine oxidase